MLALTPSERRGALVLVMLLLIGAGYDLWRARAPVPAGRFAAPPEVLMPLTPPAGPDAGPDPHAGAVPGPDSAAPAPGHAPPGAAPRRAAIDLNRADARELDGLPGIGPVIAGRIVLQRRRFGPFQGVDELLAVRGVGPRLLERIRPWATVGPRPDGAPPPSATGEDSTSKTPR